MIDCSFKYSTHRELFKFFDEGKWKAVASLDELADKTVAADIRDLVEDKGLVYFGRYRLIENNEPLDWTGFCIGSSVSSASKFKTIDGLKLVNAQTSAEVAAISQTTAIESH